MNYDHPTLYEALRNRTGCEGFEEDLREQSISAIKCQMKFNRDKYKVI